MNRNPATCLSDTMKRSQAKELRDIAKRLLALADQMDEKDAPDLFSAMCLTPTDTMAKVESLTDVKSPISPISPVSPVAKSEGEVPAPRRTRKHIHERMRDEAIPTTQPMGRKNGYFRRDHLERSIRYYNQGVSAETVRATMNAIVKELGLTCIFYNHRRYYRVSDRPRIVALAEKYLKETA